MTRINSETGTASGLWTRRPGAVGHVSSYYAETAPMLTYYPPLERNRNCDVCVIGGGLAGLTAAAELARSGSDTVLVESRRLAWAASGRNGGFVSPGFAEQIFEIEKQVGLELAQQLYRLSAEGVGYVRNTIRKENADKIIGGHGRLAMIRHNDANALERSTERMARDYGAAQTFLSSEELSQYVKSTAYRAGVLDMGCFHIQPLEYAGLLGKVAARNGASLHENSRARSIERQNGKWIVDVEGLKLTATQIVIATNVSGGPSRRVNGALVPVATYVLSAKSPSGGLAKAIRFAGCLSDSRRANDYYRLVGPPDDATLIWGGRMTTQRSQPRKLAQELVHDIRTVYPQLDDLAVTHAWTGLMGYTIHKMPIILRLDKGLWIATGFGGHGLNTTAMAGNLVASAISADDDRYKIFARFGLRWAGGFGGRVAAQLEYWRLRWLDRLAEFSVRAD
jgi:gamma-glutamylputrescine oxidase